MGANAEGHEGILPAPGPQGALGAAAAPAANQETGVQDGPRRRERMSSAIESDERRDRREGMSARATTESGSGGDTSMVSGPPTL